VRIIFLGTPEFAVPILKGICQAGHTVAAVFTACDKAAGRGRKLIALPVKLAAQKLGLTIYQLPKISSPEGIGLIEKLAPDVGVVAAFGEIISRDVLHIPGRGFLNVHASLLPRWRGAAPIQHAILAGDRKTGITVIRMTEKMDAGPVLLQSEIEIGEEETAGELSGFLARAGAQATVAALSLIESGKDTYKEQDETRVTFAPKIKKEDLRIDWRKDAVTLARLIRAFSPEPGAFAFLERSEVRPLRVKILKAAPVAQEIGPPGTVTPTKTEVLVAAGAGSLLLKRVQPEGKREMEGSEFLRGYLRSPSVRFLLPPEKH
jgi:methionyl-tRNA formyltransferase